MKKYIWLILSGICFAIPFLIPGLAWCGFIALTGLLNFCWQEKPGPASRWARFFIVWGTFWISYLGIVHWLHYVTVLGYFLLSFYLSLYVALFSRGCEYFRSYRHRTLAAAVLWVLLEYLRSIALGGFGWAFIGYTLFSYPGIIQPADIVGVYGLGFLILLGNGAVADLNLRRNKTYFYLWILLCGIAFGYSASTIHAGREKALGNPQNPVTVTVYQPNIPQSQKWNEEYTENIKQQFRKDIAALNAQGSDLIVFPESSWPEIIDRFTNDFISLTRKIEPPLLIGSITQEGTAYYNTAYLLKGGAPKGKYHKTRLVPFGEYVPLRKYLSFISILNTLEDMNAGTEHTLFELREHATFAVLICFEDVFSDLSALFCREGAQFLVNITNDAWFGNSAEPTQHLAASVLRAIENRKWVLRAANTGISGFIDPYGTMTLLKNGDLFVKGILTQKIYPNTRKTFYARHEKHLGLCWGIFLIGLMAAGSLERRKRTK